MPNTREFEFSDISILSALERAIYSKDLDFISHVFQNKDSFLKKKKTKKNIEKLLKNSYLTGKLDYFLEKKLSATLQNISFFKKNQLIFKKINNINADFFSQVNQSGHQCKDFIKRFALKYPTEFCLKMYTDKHFFNKRIHSLYSLMILLSNICYAKEKKYSFSSILNRLLGLDFQEQYRFKKIKIIFHNLIRQNNILALRVLVKNNLLKGFSRKELFAIFENLINLYPAIHLAIIESKCLEKLTKNDRKKILFQIINSKSARYRSLALKKLIKNQF